MSCITLRQNPTLLKLVTFGLYWINTNCFQIRNSRSISPSPSTNSDQSTNSSVGGGQNSKDKKTKPPPPKRKESRLISTTNHAVSSSVSEVSSPIPLDSPQGKQQKMYRSRNSSAGGAGTQSVASNADDDSNSTSLNTFKSPVGRAPDLDEIYWFWRSFFSLERLSFLWSFVQMNTLYRNMREYINESVPNVKSEKIKEIRNCLRKVSLDVRLL